MKRGIHSKIVSVTAFVIEVILFWILWFIYSYAWVNGIDIVSNILRLVSILGMLLIIVSAFLTIIRLKRNFSSDSSISNIKKISSVIVFIAAITIHLLMYFSFYDIGYSAGGLFSIENKEIIGNSYYFYTKSSDNSHLVKIECSKDVYEELIIDEDVGYTFSYRWLTYNNDKGVLAGSIDTKDIVDNRR